MSSCSSFSTPQFTPAMRVISAITQAENAQITTTVAHGYGDGLIVRIDIPKPQGLNIFGMEQMNKKIGTVTVVDSTNFTITVDSRGFDPFSIPGMLPDAFTCSQVIPIAETSSQLTEAVANTSGNQGNE